MTEYLNININKQKNMQHLIRKAKREIEENRKKAFRNIGKDVKDTEPYENKAYLEMITEASKLFNNE